MRALIDAMIHHRRVHRAAVASRLACDGLVCAWWLVAIPLRQSCLVNSFARPSPKLELEGSRRSRRIEGRARDRRTGCLISYLDRRSNNCWRRALAPDQLAVCLVWAGFG